MNKTYRYRLVQVKRASPRNAYWTVVRGSGNKGGGPREELLAVAKKHLDAAGVKALQEQLDRRHEGVVEPYTFTSALTGWRLTWHHDERDDSIAEVIRRSRSAVRTARTSHDIWAEETEKGNALALAREADAEAEKPRATRIAKRILAEIPERQQGLFGARKNPRGSTEVQTLLFDKAYFTPRAAAAWATKHGYRVSKIDKGSTRATKLRIRQHAPGGYLKGSFRTITFGPGIEAVVGRPRSHARANPSALPVAQGLFVMNPPSALAGKAREIVNWLMQRSNWATPELQRAFALGPIDAEAIRWVPRYAFGPGGRGVGWAVAQVERILADKPLRW